MLILKSGGLFISFIVCFCLGTAFVGTLSASGDIAPPSLAWWEMEETDGTVVYDSTDNGYNLTATDGFVIADAVTGSMVGSGFAFDGNGERLTHPTLLDTMPDAITIVGWVKPDATGMNALQCCWFSKQNTDVMNRLWLTFKMNGSYPSIIAANGNGANKFFNCLTTITWQDDTWYHIAFTWDDSGCKIYVNGQLEGSDPMPIMGDVIADENYIDLTIGSGGDTSKPFKGVIDDVRIYDRVLSEADILYIYDSAPGIVYYDLIVNAGTGDGSYFHNATVNIAANPPVVDYEFDIWTGDTAMVADIYDPTTTITMPKQNITVTATYKAIEYSILTVNNGDGGGIYPVNTVVSIVAGTPPGATLVFDVWTGDTATVADVNDPTTTIMILDTPVAVTATYKVVYDHTLIADAGLPVYAKTGTAILDGSGSYNRDGDEELTYQWRQITGNKLTIVDAQTPHPKISGFVRGSSVKNYEFELTVSDGVLSSIPDTVKLVVFPAFAEGVLYQTNPPFNPSLPTIIAFGGGNCVTGGGMSLPSRFNQSVNVLTVTRYGPPYSISGNMVVDYLYRMAPYYNQPIQTMGFSTGGMPAIDTAVYMNTQFADARYTVNRVSFLDGACGGVDYGYSIKQFHTNRVEDEPCWVENYYATHSKYRAGTLNIKFAVPPASHGTPPSWYFDSINFPEIWPFDVYNDGVVAGAYISVAGPGKNLNVIDPYPYYFKMLGDYYAGDPGYLDFYDQNNYPGRLPHPVTLTGPEDGATIGSEGTVLSCLESANAISYQLLFGSDPDNMDYIVSETEFPPTQVITQFPFKPTYWTVRAVDPFKTTIHADPICVYPQSVYHPVENISFGRTYPFIQLAIDEADDGEKIVVAPGVYRENLQFKGKNIILTSTDPTDWEIVDSTIIQGVGTGSVVEFAGTEDSSCVLSGFTITGGNSSTQSGGISGNLCTASIQNCIIIGNTSQNAGGGVGDVNGLISNCIIRDNQATYGGGIANCIGLIANTLIFDNQCSREGHAVHNCDGVIRNCTILGGYVDQQNLLSSCDGLFENCILAYEAGELFYNSTAVVRYCCYPDASGEGNICDDPLFVDPNNGDYHLLSDSGCINAGDSLCIPEESQTDLDGRPRLIGSCVDMGVFEFNHLPIADAGPNQITYAWIDGLADVRLDGTGSSDQDGGTLEYFWYNDANELIATGAEPNVLLPVGENVIDLVVNDGIDDSEPDSVIISVEPPIEVAGLWTPKSLNCKSRGKWIAAHVTMPELYTTEDVDVSVRCTLEPLGLESSQIEVAVDERGQVALTVFFDRESFCETDVSVGVLQLTVAGRMTSGHYFYTTDEIRIIGDAEERFLNFAAQ